MGFQAMNVWLITMSFPYPSETFANNEVTALQKLGNQVSVHALRPKHDSFSKLVSERDLSEVWITHNSIRNTLYGLWIGFTQPWLFINFIVWLLKHTWKNPRNLIKSLTLVPRSLQIYNLARQQNPDVIYLYWSHFPSLVGYLIKRRLPKIVVSLSYIAHDLHFPEFDAKNSYTPSVAQNADLIQTVTVANIPIIEKHGVAKDDIFLSYQGVNFHNIPPKKEKIKRRIVTAGRFIPDKGFDDVLSSFAQVLKDWPDASLVMLGDGDERENLEALAQSLNIRHAVDFKGFVSHDEIFKEMALAEVFLFMSKFIAERLPNVVKEAMACHCLCVVTHTPGIEEVVHDTVNGYIVKQGDVETATKCVKKAFSNPTEIIQMTDLAYQHLRDNFDLDSIMKALQGKWLQLLHSK